MQNVLRRTAQARNQAKRKAILSDKDAKRVEHKAYLREQFRYNRVRLDAARDAEARWKEDWLKGPMAPRRDAGEDGKTFGGIDMQAVNPPKLPQHLRRKYINLAPGDRVAILKGKDAGKVGEVQSVDTDNEHVIVKDHNSADVVLPEWMKKQYKESTPFSPLDLPIPIDNVRLVVPLDDPQTGNVRDVLVEHLIGGRPFLEREYGSDTPRHTRYIAGENIEIPWPRTENPDMKDEEADTVRMEVETATWTPSLEQPPFPTSVIDELRNKYSKYRTRHDPEYVRQKKMEDYRKEYLRSRTALTPQGELRALRAAQREEWNKSRRDASGNMIMPDSTADFIGQFIQGGGDKTKKATTWG